MWSCHPGLLKGQLRNNMALLNAFFIISTFLRKDNETNRKKKHVSELYALLNYAPLFIPRLLHVIIFILLMHFISSID